MSLKIVDPSKYVYSFSPYHRPALYCDPGDSVQFTSLDTCSDKLVDETCGVRKNMDAQGVPWNPVSGPVYVNGAMPGDTLKVTVEKIEITGDAVMFFDEKLVLFGQFFWGDTTIKIPIKDGYADMFGNKLELRPMLGILGISPTERTGTMNQGVFGGNMDCKEITEGSVLYLPVQVPGALLVTGDIHGLQGDGETVCGLEVPGKITLKVELIKDKAEPWPVLETKDRWYVIASKETLEDATKEAADKMVKFLWNRTDRYTIAELIGLMSICGELQFCQVVDPLQTVRYAFDKRLCLISNSKQT